MARVLRCVNASPRRVSSRSHRTCPTARRTSSIGRSSSPARPAQFGRAPASRCRWPSPRTTQTSLLCANSSWWARHKSLSLPSERVPVWQDLPEPSRRGMEALAHRADLARRHPGAAQRPQHLRPCAGERLRHRVALRAARARGNLACAQPRALFAHVRILCVRHALPSRIRTAHTRAARRSTSRR